MKPNLLCPQPHLYCPRPLHTTVISAPHTAQHDINAVAWGSPTDEGRQCSEHEGLRSCLPILRLKQWEVPSPRKLNPQPWPNGHEKLLV